MPSKIAGYLRRVSIQYKRDNDRRKTELVSSAYFHVIENTDWDNWNGGTTGHDLYLFVNEEFFHQVALSEQKDIAEAICRDLNTASESVSNEYWHKVHIDLVDENDEMYQRATSPKERHQVNPDTLSIWAPGQIRLFISHRDQHKRKAFQLAEALDGYGISSFVAHDTIEATKEWRAEIISGLETMEVMLVFLTDDFAASAYTNQEVGFALGRSTPVISLKLERSDPPGFISNQQALKGSLENPAEFSAVVQKLISEKLGRQDRIQAGLVSAFVKSPDWTETRIRFDRLKQAVTKLTDTEFDAIAKAYRSNDQLHNATYLASKYRLYNFLRQVTEGEVTISGREIKVIRQRETEEIPF